MVGKYPADVVNDRRFRAAFNHVSRSDWKRIADRFVVANSAGIASKDGYIVDEGCKAHSCASDSAAFAISASTGKGDLVFKETVDFSTGKTVMKTFAWTSMPIESTPLAGWGKTDEVTSDTVASAQESTTPSPSFDCTKAHSDAEHLICGDAQLAADDVELAELYAKAKAAVADQAAFKARTRTEWNYREQNCHDRECLVRWYADQKIALQHVAVTGDVAGD